MKTSQQYFPAHSIIVDTVKEIVFYYVFSSDEYIIDERPDTYRLATDDEKAYYEKYRTQAERFVRLSK